MQTDQIENTEIKVLNNAELVTVDGGIDGGCIPGLPPIWPPYIVQDQPVG